MAADPDGVRVVAVRARRKSVRAGVIALALAALALGVLLVVARRTEPLRSAPSPSAPAQAGSAGSVVVAQRASEVRRPRLAGAQPVRRGSARAERAPAPPAPPPPAPRSAAAAPPEATPEEPAPYEDPIVGFGPPGSGLAAFPPPGTSPPLRGIVVPEDFALPEGFVRHHQTTDEGEALPPILMFHPDYEWVDAQGNPLAIPEDRVVPAELAPTGLPIRMLELPGESSSGTSETAPAAGSVAPPDVAAPVEPAPAQPEPAP